MKRKLLSLSLLTAVACGGSQGPARSSSPAANDATNERDHQDGVYSFTSSAPTFETNSYWVEGPSGVIVFDLQFTPSEARRLLATIRAHTNKPIVLAVVLHPNPDKFNGTRVFQEEGVRVVSSAQVLAAIPAVYAQRTRAFLSRFPNDWPLEEPRPESFGSATTVIEAGGVAVKLHALGAGCSEAHVVAEYCAGTSCHLFAGDLVSNGTHAWLELGHVYEWVDRMDELLALHPARVHPGRGESGGAALLENERSYLERVRGEAISLGEGATRERLLERVFAAYPELRYRLFLQNGVDAVLRTIAEHEHPVH